MKKAVAFLLILTLLFAFAGCGAEETSSAPESKAESAPTETSSEKPASSEEESAVINPSEPDASSEEPDDESSEEPATSSEEPGETSTDVEVIPPFCTNFLSFGAVDTKVNATAANACQLTGVNVPLSYGAVVLYTNLYEDDISEGADLADFAAALFEYDEKKFDYVKTDFCEVGKVPTQISVPDDGFVVLIHKAQEKVLSTLKNLDGETVVFPHGVQPCADINYTVKKVTGKLEIDGKFSDAEWKNYHIDSVNAENPLWSYAQFEKDNYYSTAEYYAAYDDEYLYLCVVVSSPYHYCPVTPANASGMWQYECIQVKFSSVSPASEYILENFDHVANNAAVKGGTVRSYGFAANDENETCFYESGFTTTFTGKAGCSRDDAKQLTVYEVALPWAEQSITPAKGMEFGLTFSINSTNADDVAKKIWKNITYRNGGGVIGRNDWSKIPVITLG